MADLLSGRRPGKKEEAQATGYQGKFSRGRTPYGGKGGIFRSVVNVEIYGKKSVR